MTISPVIRLHPDDGVVLSRVPACRPAPSSPTA
ncbi:hypothetical protein AB7M75_001457 [Bradyrhizobium ottawaense]